MMAYEEGQTATNHETGQKYVFKNGIWTEVEGAEAALAGAETIGAAPEFQQSLGQIDLGLAMPGTPPSEAAATPSASVRLPSAEEFAEWLPAVGSGVGAAAGYVGTGGLATPLLAGLGGAAGEAIRQEIREAAGMKPATGVVQEHFDLDPGSKAAKVAGVGAEGIMGSLAEAFAGFLRKAAPTVRRSGVKQYAKALKTDATPKELKKLTDDLMVIEDRLPTGGRKRVRGKTEAHKDIVAEELDEIFAGPAGSRRGDLTETTKAMKAEREALVETPSHTLEVETKSRGRTLPGPGETRGGPVLDIRTKDVPIDEAIRSEDLAKQLEQRIAKLEERQSKRGTFAPDEPTFEARELRKAKQETGRQVEQAASEAFGDPRVTKGVNPKALAGVKQYQAERAQLRKLVPESAVSDDEFTAFSRVFDLASHDETSHFLARWGVSRATGGPLGTGTGLLAGAPFLPRTVLSKGIRDIARFMRNGQEAKAMHVFRGLLTPNETAQDDSEARSLEQ
jgi:hypothetical protein